MLDITDKRKFWTTVSPLFGNEVKTNHKTDLVEKKVLVTSDKKTAKTFKECFDETVSKLNITQNEYHTRKTGSIEESIV